jgi:hypothetical protein
MGLPLPATHFFAETSESQLSTNLLGNFNCPFAALSSNGLDSDLQLQLVEGTDGPLALAA